MSSSAELVTRALKRLHIVEPGETPAAADAADGLAALNAMLAGWLADGVNIDPDVPLAAKHEEGIVALLGVRLSEDYGTQPGPVLLKDADTGWDRLLSAYIVAPSASYDIATIKTPSRRFVDFESIGPWSASTAYVVGERATNAGNMYEVTVAGTSSTSGGPTGVNAAITDGTVTWQYIRAI